MLGLRFQNRRVKEEAWNGAKAFIHEPILSGKSDFEALFEPIFEYFKDAWFSPGEVDFRIFDDREGRKYLEFTGVISARYIPIVAPYVGNGWNEVVIFHTPRPIEAIRVRRKISLRYGGATYSDTKQLKSAITNGEVTLIHNWDGLYWEIYSSNQEIVARLAESHSATPGIEIYIPVFDREYPEPSGATLERA